MEARRSRSTLTANLVTVVARGIRTKLVFFLRAKPILKLWMPARSCHVAASISATQDPWKQKTVGAPSTHTWQSRGPLGPECFSTPGQRQKPFESEIHSTGPTIDSVRTRRVAKSGSEA